VGRLTVAARWFRLAHGKSNAISLEEQLDFIGAGKLAPVSGGNRMFKRCNLLRA
jgi:hypothetical protein